jgi:hypothetical protein
MQHLDESKSSVFSYTTNRPLASFSLRVLLQQAATHCAPKNFLIFEMNCELFQILLLPIQFLNMHQPVLLCSIWLDWYLCLKHKISCDSITRFLVIQSQGILVSGLLVTNATARAYAYLWYSRRTRLNHTINFYKIRILK